MSTNCQSAPVEINYLDSLNEGIEVRYLTD